jgi:molybdopterin-dependent oxidoreductase alpha subunit
MSGRVGDDLAPAALLRTRAEANPLGPMVTAPLSVERAPTASGGPAAVAVAINDVLRKVGVRKGLRILGAANQAGGFDCPGCAWPSPTPPHGFAVCESGARAIIDDHTTRVASPSLFATYTIPELSRRTDHWLSGQGRLTQPMIRHADANGYAPISWEEAIALIGKELRELDAAGKPNRAVFYSSARISNETAFCLQLLARELGTNNLASSSQLCHEASRVAMLGTLGSSRSPVTLADFAHAEAIFVFGQNPGSNHPRMLEALRDAKLRGAKIVAINPLREVGLLRVRDPRRLRDWLGDGTAIADLHVPVRIAGDLALLEGLSKAVLEADAVTREFIDAHTEGFSEFARTLAERSWADIVERSGVDEAQIRAAAKIYIESNATIACWGVGLTQHRTGVETVEQLLAWLLLRGNLGKPGAGPLAVLGHSNTAGCWTMGIDPRPSTALLDALEQATGVAMPRDSGYDVGSSIDAMLRGDVDVLLGVGGNLLSASPEPERVAAALRQCRLTVHVATKLNRSHLITGETALLLPCLVRGEVHSGVGGPQWSSFEDATGHVQGSQGRERPIVESLLSEPEILARIADAARPHSQIDWRALGRDHRRIRELIATLPGCESFADMLGTSAGVPLPSPTRSRVFSTATGKARLCSSSAQVTAPMPEHGLWLTTVRSHDQHNSTVYSIGDRERGIVGYRRVVLMNHDDMQRLQIEPYTQVDLISHFEGEQRRAPKWVAVPHHVRAGCVAAYWPEANVLVPASSIDPRSGTPSFKSVIITIEVGAPPALVDRYQDR